MACHERSERKVEWRHDHIACPQFGAEHLLEISGEDLGVDGPSEAAPGATGSGPP
jgi:hypothetical protein